MTDTLSKAQDLPQVPAHLDFMASHGRMLANFGIEYVLKSFGRSSDLTGGDLNLAWAMAHIIWISMDPARTGDRNRIWELDKAVPETVLKPVSVARLAREANLPYQTAKRYTLALVRSGACAKHDGGYVPSASFMTSEAVMLSVLHTAHHLSVLIQKLDASGMLEYLRDRDFSSLAAPRA